MVTMIKVDLELRMALSKNPLVKELLQTLTCFKFKHFSQIIRLGIAVGKALQICSKRPSEVLVSDEVAHHVEHAPSLFIAVSIKEVLRVFVYFCYNGPSISGSGLFKIVVSSLHNIILELVLAFACLPVECLTVGSKSFIEPDMLPITACDKVTKPLVCKLMRYKIIACKVEVGFFVMKCIQR